MKKEIAVLTALTWFLGALAGFVMHDFILPHRDQSSEITKAYNSATKASEEASACYRGQIELNKKLSGCYDGQAKILSDETQMLRGFNKQIDEINSSLGIPR